ncbi:MAG: glycoside hydrolase family 92 protein, partial [Clostridia bacterium]|nr:glycoside hydrolase family 92 protein [Clostridia bacterium]
MINKPLKEPFDYIDPAIDTGKPKPRWVFFQSASLPFGMVQLSPDTDLEGTWGVGYRYHSKRIRCFSHVHQWQLSAIAVLPGSGDIPFEKGYRFSHRDEIVKPGYHKVNLTDCKIKAELSATLRTGIHKYTFQEKKNKFILLDLIRRLGPSDIASHEVILLDNQSLHGYVENAPTIRRPKPCRIFFHLECNEPFVLKEKEGLYFLTFTNEYINEVTLKIAISFVSKENAKLNMESEVNHFDFEKVKEEAKNAWIKYISVITVKSSHEKQLIKFYTDLWRTAMGGHIISDVNHEYMDMTGIDPVIRKADSYDFISNADIFWGAHWSLSLVYDLLYPEIKSDYCKSLIQFSENGGYIPRGPSGGNYTHVMIGAHSGSFIVSAFYKGIRNLDMDAAYKGIRANAFTGGLMSKSGYEHDSCLDGGIDEYIEKGYIPARKPKSQGFHCDSASQTVEYAFDDWVLSNLAKSMNNKDDYEYFLKRSQNY